MSRLGREAPWAKAAAWDPVGFSYVLLILLLALPMLTLAITPYVSFDAEVYHLRVPKAWARVLWSVYSSSPPRGTP